jgi:hypothetical protein
LSAISKSHEAETEDTMRAINLNTAIYEKNNQTLESFNNSLLTATATKAHLTYNGLGSRPPIIINNKSPGPGTSSLQEREEKAKRELGGTFGSPNKQSSINALLMSRSIPTSTSTPISALNTSNNSVSIDDAAASGNRRGGTLDSVIHSLEEEFSSLNNQYRVLLSTCSTTVGHGKGSKLSSKEASSAQELVTVINKLHKKGEQLRKLRIGSPSMNMFSSTSSSSYIDNIGNTNINLNTTINRSPVVANTNTNTYTYTNTNSNNTTNVTPTSGDSTFISATGSASFNQNKFHSPQVMAPYMKYKNNTPGAPKELHDNVMDFDIQNLNATSHSADSPAARYS